jgi:ribosome recycling factor
MKQTMEQSFAELMATQMKLMNKTISKLPTPKKKSYIGDNIVLLDYTPQTYSAAITAIEALGATKLIINMYHSKHRIAIVF